MKLESCFLIWLHNLGPESVKDNCVGSTPMKCSGVPERPKISLQQRDGNGISSRYRSYRLASRRAVRFFGTLCLVFFLWWASPKDWHFNYRDDQQKNDPSNSQSRVIAMVAFDRDKYFKKSIECFFKARGSEGYLLLVAIDGQNQDPNLGWKRVVRHAEDLAALSSREMLPVKEIKVSVSGKNLGVWKNKKRAVAWGFEYTDFLIVLEDDIILDFDALKWFEFQGQAGTLSENSRWAVTTCWSNLFPADDDPLVISQDILSVKLLQLLETYIERPWATPWGWAIWRRTWEMFGPEWTGQDQHLGWLVRNHSMVETLPVVARCNNIGAEGVNKRGMFEGHIQGRSLTSGIFPNALMCHYRPLSTLYRNQITETIAYNEINKILRSGMVVSKKFDNITDLERVGDMLLEYAIDKLANHSVSC